MNKICTSLEQSKKLIDLGIDIKTADMYWWHNGQRYYVETKEHNDFQRSDIPAWSFTALLELMPLINHDTANVFKEEDGTYTALYRYTKGSPVITKKESAIDAAFEMVCWLKENKKL